MKKVFFWICIVAMLAISACASSKSGCYMSRNFSGTH